MYHQTVPASQPELRAYRQTASDQDARVLQFFRQCPRELFTQEQIHELVMPTEPRSSVCRTINTLTREGFLEKTPLTVMGSMGRRVHTWRLLPPGPAQRALL
jgi:hypothetical protein